MTSEDFPYVPIRLHVRGMTFNGSALLDTGFEDALAVPSSLLEELPGPAEFQGRWQVADDRIITAPTYVGEVEFADMGRLSIQFTVLGHEFIVGRRIMNRYRVCFDHGDRITIEP
ncbi:MAG: hypothetical protein IIC24_00585 [Chloroflexi bacterium]|nr:hypothetical protein [Chloroflexota bacterium]